MKRLLERLQGLWRHFREHPAAIWLRRHPVGASRIDSPAIGPSLFAEYPGNNPRDTDHRFAITWHEGIQIDQMSNSVRHLINHASDDHRAITVTHQDDTLQILFHEHADDVLDMGI